MQEVSSATQRRTADTVSLHPTTVVLLLAHCGVQSAVRVRSPPADQHRQLMAVRQYLTTAVLQVHAGSADQTEKERVNSRRRASSRWTVSKNTENSTAQKLSSKTTNLTISSFSPVLVTHVLLPHLWEIIDRRRLQLFGHVVRLENNIPAHRALWQAICVRGNIRLDSRWHRPRGCLRQTWLHHIADGSPLGIRMEWHRAANRGHGESTRRNCAVYAI